MNATDYLKKQERELLAKLRPVYGLHTMNWYLDNDTIAHEHQTEVKALVAAWEQYHVNQREVNAAIELQRRAK